jgi:glucose/arabinose dehydrogenase
VGNLIGFGNKTKKNRIPVWLPTIPVVLTVLLVLSITAAAKPAAQTIGEVLYLPLIPDGDLPEATDFPDPDNYEWVNIQGGLNQPVEIVFPDDGSNRMFILEQSGTIRIRKNGALLSTPFLDLTGTVTQGPGLGERGLLGLAFHPNYEDNGYFFVYYTDLDSDTVVSRFQVSSDPDIADENSETMVLTLDQPDTNHNGGHLEFGPDGMLYIGLGDGGGGGDPDENAQDLTTLLGSILRIDVDTFPYSIPPDNPFVGTGNEEEIWLYGLRNPWKFHFDPTSGEFFMGDVGQGSWEEIDYLPADASGGNNFGWDYYEGNANYEGNPPGNIDFTFPIQVYETHVNGTCSVTGGVVYRGQLSEWNGIYFYGDFCSGDVWGLLQDHNGAWVNQFLYDTGASISSFGYDHSGEIYLANRNGSIYHLQEK